MSQTCQRCGFENSAEAIVCMRCDTELDDENARALVGQTILGTYRIIDILGRGGMSVVYRAQHTMTEQRVALKVLPPELAIHASLKTRFLEEAKALARLEHPNIVRLYNFGEEAGRFVLAMELVEGRTFEKMIFEGGKVAWPLTARIGVEVCKALDYAHSRGVVHRDIKPSNVLVRDDGTSTVMDFGIAKMTESTRLTATGQTMGTVRYMSPEQVRGQVVDHRTDIYSLGVALYEGLAGDTPFTGDTHFDIMSKHLSEPMPSLRAVVPEVPEALEAIIRRSLAKDKEERTPTADEMREALELLLRDVPEAEKRPAPTTATPVRERDKTPIPAPRPLPTGLASRLEPAFVDPGAPSKPAPSRAKLWIGLAVGVVAAGATALFVLKGDGQGGVAVAMPDAPPPVAPRDAAASSAPAWPEPLTVPRLPYVVDRRFDAPESVRILATRKLDAAHAARTYAQARSRFVQFAEKQKVGSAVEIHPLNLAIVPERVMCDRALHAPSPPPPNCGQLGFFYEPRTRTLFVTDDDSTDLVSIPEGAAVHLCRTTPALHQKGCGTLLLNPYFDQVERDL